MRDTPIPGPKPSPVLPFQSQEKCVPGRLGIHVTPDQNRLEVAEVKTSRKQHKPAEEDRLPPNFALVRLNSGVRLDQQEQTAKAKSDSQPERDPLSPVSTTLISVTTADRKEPPNADPRKNQASQAEELDGAVRKRTGMPFQNQRIVRMGPEARQNSHVLINRKERREHKEKTRRSLGSWGAAVFQCSDWGEKISSCFHFPVPE